MRKYSNPENLATVGLFSALKKSRFQSAAIYLKAANLNAQSLLENTDYTITEIANMVGYTNSLYFSRLFHKYIGMSPKNIESKTQRKSQGVKNKTRLAKTKPNRVL